MAALRLPPETLEEIVIYSASIDPPILDAESLALLKIGWMALLRVCHVWRHVAINCGRAWALGLTQLPHQLSLAAQRAKKYSRHFELSSSIPAFHVRNPSAPRYPSKYWRWHPDFISKILAIARENLDLLGSIICTDPWDVYGIAHALVEPSKHQTLHELRALELKTTMRRQGGRSTMLYVKLDSS